MTAEWRNGRSDFVAAKDARKEGLERSFKRGHAGTNDRNVDFAGRPDGRTTSGETGIGDQIDSTD